MRRTPTPTRTDTLCPYPTLCRSDPSSPACHHPQQRPQGDPMSKSIPVRHALSAAALALFLTGAATETFAQSASDAFNVGRSEEHTSELQSLMRISYAVFCLKKKKNPKHNLLI